MHHTARAMIERINPVTCTHASARTSSAQRRPTAKKSYGQAGQTRLRTTRQSN